MRMTVKQIRELIKDYPVEFDKIHDFTGKNDRYHENHNRLVSNDNLFTLSSLNVTRSLWKVMIWPQGDTTNLSKPIEVISGLPLRDCLDHMFKSPYDYPAWVWRPTKNEDLKEQWESDYSNYKTSFLKVDNGDRTYRIEVRFIVYRALFGHHPTWLPQDEERGAREGFSTKFWLMVQDNINPVFADMALLYYRCKYDSVVTKTENNDQLWEEFPFKDCDIIYSK